MTADGVAGSVRGRHELPTVVVANHREWRRSSRPEHLAQHLIPRPKGLLSALVQNQNLIHRSKRAGTMRDHDDDTAAGTNALRSPASGPLRPRVEIGVGLVQNDEEWIAIERAGERNSLALTRRQRRTRLSDARVVALG